MGAATGILILAPGTPQALDLSAWLNVQDDAGADPYDPAFTNKIFSHALLKEGGVQSLENLQLKEMMWPVNLYATTRPALHSLIENINNLLETPGMTVLWQDPQASTPTYFDLAAGQLDIKYSYFKGQQCWMPGNLRLFVQPLGRTATMRLVASAIGTGPVLQLPIASPIVGDAGALMQAQISVATSGGGEGVALSVLPAGWQSEFHAASMTLAFGASLVGGSGAVGSQFIRLNTASGDIDLGAAALVPSTYNIGPVRTLAVVRQPTGAATALLQAQLILDNQTVQNGPTTILGGSNEHGWQLLDLGAFSIASTVPYGTIQLWIQAVAAGSNTIIDLTDLIVLPDSQTVFLSDANAQTTPSLAYVFDAVANESYSSVPGAPVFRRQTSLQRGVVPQLPPTARATSQLVAIRQPYAFNQPANEPWAASVTVRERVRFAF